MVHCHVPYSSHGHGDESHSAEFPVEASAVAFSSRSGRRRGQRISTRGKHSLVRRVHQKRPEPFDGPDHLEHDPIQPNFKRAETSASAGASHYHDCTDASLPFSAGGGSRTNATRAPWSNIRSPTPNGMANPGDGYQPAFSAVLGESGKDLPGDVRKGVEVIPAIEVKGLTYSYHDGTQALRGVTFAVDQGESVGLIGPNGSGKSTLLLHLNGTLPEDSSPDGSLNILGRTITRQTLEEVRRQVGLVFQNPDDQLFCPTVEEDVRFGPEQFGLDAHEVRNYVEVALRQVGLTLDRYGRRSTHHLSQGEKRRVCLAGVLACQPQILVLDEPTSDLDPRGRREFKALLNQLTCTKFIATHDLELVVELCSRVVVLDEGQVAADGPVAEVLNNERLMLDHGLERPHILRHAHPH